MYARVITLVLLFMLLLIGIEIAHRGRVISADVPMPALVMPTTAPADRLEMHIGDINFSDLPLKAAIDTLATRSRTNLGADWDALQTAGIDTTQPVTLRLRNPTLSTALEGICDEVVTNSRTTVGVAEDPRGILLLGTANEYQRSVTTLPRFYDVDDLISPTVAYHPPTEQYQVYPLVPLQVRPDLQRLAIALQPFFGRNDIGCFGRRLFVSGYLDAHQKIAAVLHCLRNPTDISKTATTRPTLSLLPRIPRFVIPPGTSASQALQMWKQVGASNVIVELSPQDQLRLAIADDSMIIGSTFTECTLEEIATELIDCCRWPFIVIPRGQEDNRVHIRMAPLEPILRAYDVSEIVAHPEAWIDLPRNYSSDDNPDVDTMLSRRVLDLGLLIDSSGLSNTTDDIAVWNGILLLNEPPKVHDHVVRFLDHLQRTGRLYDPPLDQ